MYNTERKKQFLEERKEQAAISNNLQNIFDLAEGFEIEHNRDLCEWNSDEIIAFYKYYSTPNIQSLVQIHNSLTMYTNWCISNGLVSDNQNHFVEVNSVTLCKCVNLNVLREMSFTREKLLELIRQLPNYVDQYLLLGLFEGIPVKQNCIFEAKLSDIYNGNILRLANGKEIKISNELKHIMNIGAEEEVHVALSEKRKEFPYEFTDGDHVLRHIKRKSARLNNAIIIGTMIRKCAMFLDLPVLTIRALSESGRMWYINEIAKENGITIEKAITTYRKEIEFRYGKIQNKITFINTYGVLIKEMYGE